MTFISWLADRLDPSDDRPPDQVIGGEENPYMLRWWLVRSRALSIYFHTFLRSDEDEALHDHPWLFNFSLLLTGEYTEETIAPGGIHKKTIRRAGDFKFRGLGAHRIELHNGSCDSLFITGPIVREWGFHCPISGWKFWKDFLKDKETRGTGCGEP